MKIALPAVLVLFAVACTAEKAVVTEGVAFVSPADNAVVGDTFVVHLSAEGLKIVPAAAPVAGEAHHHIFVDIDPTPDSLPIPKTDGIFHIGTGADSLVMILPPGKHRLIAVPATGDHIPVKGARRDTLNIEVKAPVTPS